MLRSELHFQNLDRPRSHLTVATLLDPSTEESTPNSRRVADGCMNAYTLPAASRLDDELRLAEDVVRMQLPPKYRAQASRPTSANLLRVSQMISPMDRLYCWYCVGTRQ